MNYVAEVEGTSPCGGASEGAASVCGGWVLESQSWTTGVKWRGRSFTKQRDGRPRRYNRLGDQLLRRQFLQRVFLYTGQVPDLLFRSVNSFIFHLPIDSATYSLVSPVISQLSVSKSLCVCSLQIQCHNVFDYNIFMYLSSKSINILVSNYNFIRQWIHW